VCIASLLPITIFTQKNAAHGIVAVLAVKSRAGVTQKIKFYYTMQGAF
jgi:hypothetical protein